MKPNKQFISIIIIILLSVLTIYNYVNRKTEILKDNKAVNNNSQRIASLSNSINLFGKNIKDMTMSGLITQKEEIVSFKDPTLIIMLSNLGCSKCQNRELENINKYIKSTSNHKIQIIAVGNKNDRDKILKIRKVTQVEISFYLIEQSDFMNEYNIENKYPQYILVQNNKVYFSFLPQQEDDVFSNWFFATLKKIDNNYN